MSRISRSIGKTWAKVEKLIPTPKWQEFNYTDEHSEEAFLEREQLDQMIEHRERQNALFIKLLNTKYGVLCTLRGIPIRAATKREARIHASGRFIFHDGVKRFVRTE